MAEVDVNYSTVVFKNKKTPPHQVKKEEETVYDEVKEQSKTTEQTADTKGLLPDKSNRNDHHQQLICCLGVLCVILLLGIVAVSVYFTLKHKSDASELKQIKANQTTLIAEYLNLTKINSKLWRDNNNLTQNYIADKQQLKVKIQQLEKQRNNLTEQIKNMVENWNEQNVSRAQWSIDSYCPKGSAGRQCTACQKGWLPSQSSCYVINNAKPPNRRTWEGARGDCRGKNSDLAVIVNEAEKLFTTNNSWNEPGINGYWIGLRAENGTWKWIDGSSLTESSWMSSPPTNNSCVISLQNQPWKSVSCDDKNAWICEKKALSV